MARVLRSDADGGLSSFINRSIGHKRGASSAALRYMSIKYRALFNQGLVHLDIFEDSLEMHNACNAIYLQL
jgi:hypothetical protein